MADTDEEGISDFQEIEKFGTNPLQSDTDNDGMSDGTEVECGLNPCEKDSDGNGTEIKRRLLTQKVRLDGYEGMDEKTLMLYPMVEITGKGDYSKKLNAINLKNTPLLEKSFIVVKYMILFMMKR